VLTGYLGDALQARPVAKIITALKLVNPDALYLCDPVIGDHAGLYVPEQTAEAIRDHLIPLADIATPNRFELQWLTGAAVRDNQAIIAAACTLGPRTVIATSAHAMMAGNTGNILVNDEAAIMAEHRQIAGPPNGLGDLTAALFLAKILAGFSHEKALQHTTAAVFEVMASAAKRGSNELMLAADASSLAHPMAMVQMRRIMRPKPKVPA
jgi:pyridoxine kinase